MLNRVITTDRREFLKRSALFSGVSLIGSSAFAQKTKTKTETTARFAITYKGQKFGIKITPLKSGVNLMTVREMGGKKRRYATAFRFKTSPTTVNIMNGKYQVTKKGNWFTTNAPGFLIGPPEPNQPGGQQPTTQGFLGLLRGIADAIDAVADFLEGVVEERDELYGKLGDIIVKKIQGDGFMPPPPGTKEMPGVWY